MVILRKGKKIITRKPTAYDIADSVELLDALSHAGASEEQIKNIKTFLNRNAFTLAIHGAKARIGGGFIVECEAREGE